MIFLATDNECLYIHYVIMTEPIQHVSSLSGLYFHASVVKLFSVNTSENRGWNIYGK